MRIIAGKYKGRTLLEFKGKDVRPTGDMAREALFSILQSVICGSVFYDAFCGSGAVGIEADSRGASEVICTDNNESSIKLAKENAKKLGASVEIVHCGVEDFLRRTDKKFDIIFLDPPYKTDLGEKAIEEIVKYNVLKDDGVVIFESDRDFADNLSGLIKTDRRKYGKAIFSFYKKENL